MESATSAVVKPQTEQKSKKKSKNKKQTTKIIEQNQVESGVNGLVQAVDDLHIVGNGLAEPQLVNGSSKEATHKSHNGHHPANSELDVCKQRTRKSKSKSEEQEEVCEASAKLGNGLENGFDAHNKDLDVNTAAPTVLTTTAKQNDTATEIASSVSSPASNLSKVHIEYTEYQSELQMHDIMRLIQAELSEPYSIYTYRYFIYNWPKLCFLAAHGNEYVGAIVCKLDMHMNVKRGYIAMLAVRKEYRNLKIGSTLVQMAIEAMLKDNADEVVLETEMRNYAALHLYENLGFVRDKRLFRYYLNGVDALRLKLWFR